jgi:conjugal transfer mating pair stabilization protein TraN
MKYILIFFFSLVSLYGIGCSDFKNFESFNGHYYTVTVNKFEFDEARQIALNNNGYLAIPNNQAENDFIKDLIGGNKSAWIGISDPLFIQNFCYETSLNCLTDDSRFRDIDGNYLNYKNWDSGEPNNLVMEDDVIEGKTQVSPLGEYWVFMDGNNGKWADIGNHAGTVNYPARYIAVFEFENVPECMPIDDLDTTLINPKCNTQIWDEVVGNLETGTNLDCQTDIYGNQYCPSALAEASHVWGYDDGYSIAEAGSYTEYASKTVTTYTEEPNSYMSCSTGKYDSLTGECIYGGLYQIALNRDPDIAGYHNRKDTYSSPPSYSNITGFINAAFINGEPYVCNNIGNYTRDSKAKEIIAAYVWYLGRCPDADGWNNYYTLDNWTIQGGLTAFIEAAKPECTMRGACPYTPPLVLTAPPHIINECNTGLQYDSFQDKCVGSTSTCPIGYIDMGTSGDEACKRTKEYSYYKYLCSNETSSQGYNYSVIDSGGDCNPQSSNDLIDTNRDGVGDSCNSPTPPSNNCRRDEFLCKFDENRPAVWINNKWQCSPFPCIGNENIEDLDANININDKDNDGWDENGGCNGQLLIFNGKTMTCRNKDVLFGLFGGGCCNKEKVFFGLVACKADEKILIKKREIEHTHYVGTFCSKKLKFPKVCIQWKESYCTFNSELARIIQEQGREQLNIGWGHASSPECRGFTPDEFQRLDFSKIDLSSFIDTINIDTSNLENIGQFVQDKVTNFFSN